MSSHGHYRQTWALAFVILLVGCDGGTEPQVLNIAGTWQFSETLNNVTLQVSCNNTGTINVVQSGTTFSGSYLQQGTCTSPSGSFDNSGAGTITGGQLEGNTISFQVPFCQYQGTVSGSPPNRVVGTGSCTYQIGGQTIVFQSTWQASR